MKKLINEIITDIRKRHKLSRKGLENLSGFKERTIIGYERGEREVSDKYIEFMSLYFGYYEDYIRAISFKSNSIDGALRTLLMYQSIYDYNDTKMSSLLSDYNIKFDELKEDLKSGNFHKKNESNVDLFIIAEILKIKPSLMHGNLEKLKSYRLENVKKEKYQELKKEQPSEDYITLISSIYINDSERKELLKDIVNRENIAEKNGINITPEYYASIIKKRNQPKENYTPSTALNEIPSKYKEIVELLPFAPDSFIDTLTDKLRTLKETQQL